MKTCRNFLALCCDSTIFSRNLLMRPTCLFLLTTWSLLAGCLASLSLSSSNLETALNFASRSEATNLVRIGCGEGRPAKRNRSMAPGQGSTWPTRFECARLRHNLAREVDGYSLCSFTASQPVGINIVTTQNLFLQQFAPLKALPRRRYGRHPEPPS